MKTLILGMALITASAGILSAGSQLSQKITSNFSNYPTGEPITLVYAISNTGSSPLTYKFSSSKQFDLWITLSGREVYRYSRGRMYAQAVTTVTLAPGETKEYRVTWNQKTVEGKNAAPGLYTVSAQLLPQGSKPPVAQSRVRVGGKEDHAVQVTVAEAIRRVGDFAERPASISATYKGWKPDPGDANTKYGPPVSRSDWAVCDSTGCMYVHGSIGLDPMESIGAKVNVVGRLKKTAKGQVYMLLDSAK